MPCQILENPRGNHKELNWIYVSPSWLWDGWMDWLESVLKVLQWRNQIQKQGYHTAANAQRASMSKPNWDWNLQHRTLSRWEWRPLKLKRTWFMLNYAIYFSWLWDGWLDWLECLLTYLRWRNQIQKQGYHTAADAQRASMLKPNWDWNLQHKTLSRWELKSRINRKSKLCKTLRHNPPCCSHHCAEFYCWSSRVAGKLSGGVCGVRRTWGETSIYTKRYGGEQTSLSLFWRQLLAGQHDT